MSATISQGLQAVTNGLRNQDTDRKLEFIEELQRLGVSKYVDLPQLVVVGDQSSGKSSVLQAITRLPFPVSDKMCTRFATEVVLHRFSGSSSMAISIKPPAHSSTSTNSRQQQIYSWERNISDIDRLDSAEFAAKFSALLNEGSREIFRSEINNDILSEATLEISFRSPQGIDLRIIDIPGLVTVGHQAHVTARALVDKYISNPRSIILAVAHPGDPGTQEVFQILRQIPDREIRVIGAITKCDRKQEGAENWVFDTINNKREPQNPHYLAQGWFGLRNRLPIESNTSNDERDQAEAALFGHGIWEDLGQPTKLGIGKLKKALTVMLNTHITNSIPHLVPQIQERLSSCNLRLATLGRPRETKHAQLECMVDLATKFHNLSTYALDGNYDKLPSAEEGLKIRKIVLDKLENFRELMKKDLERLFPMEIDFRFNSRDGNDWHDDILDIREYREIDERIKENRGKESPGEVNPCVLGMLWRSKTKKWSKDTKDVLNKLVASINVSVGLLLQSATDDEDLRRNTLQWISECDKQVPQSALAELERLISDEENGLIWTSNPSRNTKIQEISSTRIRNMTSRLMDNYSGSINRGICRSEIEAWLGRRKDVAAIFNTYDLLASYYAVSMNRFIDNFGHQVIERHLLGPQSPLRILQPNYVVQKLQENDELLQRLAGEKERTTAKRTSLRQEKASLEQALSKAQAYGYYPS